MMDSTNGAIAQLVEHFNGIEGVSGSNPLSSIKFSELKELWLLQHSIL